jgi:hypothetical protein
MTGNSVVLRAETGDFREGPDIHVMDSDDRLAIYGA